MKRLVLNSTVAVFALLTAGNALANDYNSGIVTKSPGSEFTQVEFGSGWYLRGDISYNIRGESETSQTLLTTPSGETFGVEADYDDSIGARIGAGYYVSPNIRIEATAESIFNSTFSGLSSRGFAGSRVVEVQEANPADPANPIITPDTVFFDDSGNVTGSTAGAYQRVVGNRANPISGSEELQAEYSAFSLMLNGYIDLPSVGAVTPYVGGGIGYGRISYNQTRTLRCVPSGAEEACAFPPGAAGAETEQELTRNEEYWAPGYSLTAGASYRMNDRTSLDVNYSFTDFAGGDDIVYEDGTAIADEGFQLHQVRAGIRYDIW